MLGSLKLLFDENMKDYEKARILMKGLHFIDKNYDIN
jgi:hypothetical protein